MPLGYIIIFVIFGQSGAADKQRASDKQTTGEE